MERTARTEWIILYPIRSIGDLACEVLPVLPTALGWAQPVGVKRKSVGENKKTGVD